MQMDRIKTVNRTMFAISVLFTGAIAGAFIWFILFLMNLGIRALWDRIPVYLGSFYPLIVCILGGLIIGFFTKRFGPYPEDLKAVMAAVKRDGRYEYDKVGRMSVGALLPMIFGGSIGPEAGLTGVIAAICTWVGDRMKGFGNDFRELSRIGTYAALSAIFTAPLYGFAGAIDGSRTAGNREDVRITKITRIVVYIIAVLGAFVTFLVLSDTFGGGLSLPRYTEIGYGVDEFVWLLPLAFIGALAGWLFCVLDSLFGRLSGIMNDRPVLKATVAGAILGAFGMILPLTMFAGEVQAEELNETWMTMSALVLISTGIAKIAVTAMCVNMGWRGGHFFPIIFSGISLGYGLSILAGIDPVFCVCATVAAVMGGAMRKPLMSVLLLFLCFPIHSVVVLAVAACIGSLIPLPKSMRDADVDPSSADTPEA